VERPTAEGELLKNSGVHRKNCISRFIFINEVMK
jgi:hypothetical protein